jgi:CubicO group peptidase (beta-lactamase class C family)
MFISARDQARFGLLTLRRGRWNDRQILSEEWIRRALTPTPVQANYGFMNYYLNTNRKQWADAPPEAFAHRGAGTNAIYVDPVNDLVVVARWIDGKALGEFVKRVLAAIEAPAAGPAAH